jgi:hypothetical protein
MASKRAEPTPLQDAIRAQQSVVNQIADEHADAMQMAQKAGNRLEIAHGVLNDLLAQQQAER